MIEREGLIVQDHKGSHRRLFLLFAATNLIAAALAAVHGQTAMALVGFIVCLWALAHARLS